MDIFRIVQNVWNANDNKSLIEVDEIGQPNWLTKGIENTRIEIRKNSTMNDGYTDYYQGKQQSTDGLLFWIRLVV